MAVRLGWPQSKVSRLEPGRQTPTRADLMAWADAVERPDAAAELVGRLRTVETQYRSYRRQLAGGAVPLQEAYAAQTAKTSVRQSVDSHWLPGLSGPRRMPERCSLGSRCCTRTSAAWTPPWKSG
ncbi:helix-turn-helix domain-containing protein (plasmid) [Kitasatospora sp. NBC_00070]|uniref:helix-turn-helix domain-containing protein n=1 Tax=Kitasatospora sp. NBC_00070 TaxID=2975962 RepID=UPI002F9110BC